MNRFAVSPKQGAPFPVESDGYSIHPSGSLAFTVGSGDETRAILVIAAHAWASVRPIPADPQEQPVVKGRRGTVLKNVNVKGAKTEDDGLKVNEDGTVTVGEGVTINAKGKVIVDGIDITAQVRAAAEAAKGEQPAAAPPAPAPNRAARRRRK